MKKTIIAFLSILFLTNLAKGQMVEIVMKDSSKRIAEINANSSTQLFTTSGTLNYSDIESIKFEVDDSNANKLREKLSNTGIKILMGDQTQIFNVGAVTDQPKKGDKKIILVCSDSTDALYKRVGQHFSLKGYAIENTSKDFLTIKTALKETSKLNFSYFLNIIIVDKKVIISAQWKLNNSILAGTQESGFYDWEFVHGKEGTFSMTVNSVLYNDLIRNLSDFKRLRTEFE